MSKSQRKDQKTATLGHKEQDKGCAVGTAPMPLVLPAQGRAEHARLGVVER